MQTLELDDTTPASSAYLVEMRKALVLQQGGIATRINYDSIEVMDLETFISTEIPKIRRASKDLTIIRDSNTSSISMIMDKKVTKYAVADIDDVPLEKLSDQLKTSEERTFFPNIHYPLVGYVESLRGVAITVLITNKEVIYSNGSNREKVLNEKIYLPPLWFKVTLNHAKNIQNINIAVVPEAEPNCLNTKLKAWPLTNVFDSGNVCQGGSYLKSATDLELTDGIAVQHAIDLIFTSKWNNDVVWRPTNQGGLKDAYAIATHKGEFDEAIERAANKKSICDLFRTVCILKDPEGWRSIPYTNLPRSASVFLRGGQ